MRKWLTAVLLALTVSTAAYAVPLYLVLGASVALHTAFGLIYDYFQKPVTTPRGTIKAVLKLDDTVPDDDIAAQQGSVEQSKTIIAKGPYSYTVPCPSSYCKRASNYIITADTEAELLNKLNTCPSDVCTYGGNVPSAFSAVYRGNVSGSSSVWINGNPYKRISWLINNATYTSDFYASGGASCPAGYTFNTTSGKCDLTDIQQARAQGGYDGVCIVSGGVPNPFDPDCSYLRDNGYLASATAPDGEPVTAITDKGGDGTTVAQKKVPASEGGGNDISQTKASSDGGKRREDTRVKPSGEVGSTNTTNYPSNPPPLYPGDPGGTATPGGTGTGTNGGTSCGGPGQPACNFKLDGDGKLKIDPEGKGEGDLPDGTTEAGAFQDTKTFLDPVKGKLTGFFSFQLPSHASQCPAIHIEWHAWGLDLDTSSNFMCEWLADHQQLISGLMSFLYLVSALLIILGA